MLSHLVGNNLGVGYIVGQGQSNFDSDQHKMNKLELVEQPQQLAWFDLLLLFFPFFFLLFSQMMGGGDYSAGEVDPVAFLVALLLS